MKDIKTLVEFCNLVVPVYIYKITWLIGGYNWEFMPSNVVDRSCDGEDSAIVCFTNQVGASP
jgi:hypothetical protein